MSYKLWIIKEDNDEVTMEYMKIVCEAAVEVGFDTHIVTYAEVVKQSKKNDYFFSILSKTFLKLRLTGRKKVSLWLQGIVPEESFLKHHSRIRYYILSLIEWYSLIKAQYILYVSEEMKNYVKSKYNLKNNINCSIMPCFNTQLNVDAFYDEKYDNNVFCYAGGISVWQEFDSVLACYKKIEDIGLKNCKLLLLVPDKELAIEKMQQYGIKNYEIDYVKVSELNDRIKEAKFGFLFRKNHPVNQVATPTKFSTYVANGIIPIFSDTLKDFYNNSRDNRFVIPLKDYDECIELVKQYEFIEKNDVLAEYETIFFNYYNREKYIKLIADKLELLKVNEV